MSVDNAAVIDGLGIAKDDGEVVLTISDHLTWSDEQQHFRLLEEKVSGYLRFIRSGQLIEVLPQAVRRFVRIDLIYMHLPTERALTFLMATKKQLQESNVNLMYYLLPDGY
jgi:hypothetical protein